MARFLVLCLSGFVLSGFVLSGFVPSRAKNGGTVGIKGGSVISTYANFKIDLFMKCAKAVY